MRKLSVYVDGGCRKKVSAWCFYIPELGIACFGYHSKNKRRGSYEAELRALKEALLFIQDNYPKAKVTIFSDHKANVASLYSKKGLNHIHAEEVRKLFLNINSIRAIWVPRHCSGIKVADSYCSHLIQLELTRISLLYAISELTKIMESDMSSLEKIESLKSALESLNARRSMLEQLVNKKIAESEALKEELISKNVDINNLPSEKQALEEKLALLLKQAGETIKTYEEQLDTLQSQVM